jgi:peptidyl-prolyl cis-trans isomerase D
MLQELHEKIHGWLAWLVVGIIGLTFVFFGVSYYANSNSASAVKATVNGEDISLYDFDTVYRRLKSGETEFNANSESKLKQQALNELIQTKLLLQAGKENGFYISQQQLEKEVYAIPGLQEDGQFSPERFQQFLSSKMLSQNDYFEMLKTYLLNQQIHFSYMGTSFVLPNELSEYVSYANQKRSYDFIVIEPSKLVLAQQPSEKEIQDYFDAHKQQFLTSEKVSLDYVLLSMKHEMQQAKVSPEEVKAYYEENQASYQTPARYKVAHIYLNNALDKDGALTKNAQAKVGEIQKALKTQSFSSVAAKYSDDLLAKDGEMPWLTAGLMDNNLLNTVTNLKKNQVASEPVMTNGGVEIIKLVDIDPSKLTPFDDVKNSIQTHLISEQAQQKFQQKAEQLADLSYQNPDSLSEVSSALDLPITKTALSTRQAGFMAPLNNNKVIQAAFSEEVLVDKNNSQPIQLNDDAIVVIRVKQHQKSVVKSFDSVKAQIANLLVTQAQNKQAQSLSQSLLKSLQKDQQIQVKELLSKNDLKWQQAENMLRTSEKGIDPLINVSAFELPYKENGKSQYKMSTLINGNVVIYNLKSVKAGQLSDVGTSQLELIQQRLASSSGIKAYELYMQALRKNAKIDVF